MTQTTLYSNKKVFFSFYKNALSRIKGVAILYSVFSVLFFPVIYLLNVDRALSQNYTSYRLMFLTGTPIYHAITVMTYFPIIIAASILLTVMANNFIQNKKAVDVFHSMPIKREKLLTANTLAVLTVLLVPMAVCYFIVALTTPEIAQVTGQMIFAEFLRVAILSVILVAIASFCSVCCNAVLDSIIFSFALSIVIPCFAVLSMMLQSNYLFGYFRSDEIINFVNFSPTIMMFSMVDVLSYYETVNSQTFLNIAYIIVAVLIFCLSCFLYKKRKSEIAQSGETRGFLYQAIMILSSIGAGMLISVISTVFFGQSRNLQEFDIKSIILGSIFSMVIYFAFNALMSRTFKQTKTSVMYLMLAALLPLVISFGIAIDVFGYETFVPDLSKISSVSINYSREDGQPIRVHNSNETIYVYDNTEYKSPEAVQLISNIHKSIVSKDMTQENVDSKQQVRASISEENTLQNGKEIYMRLTYTLKSGKKVYRHYNVEASIEQQKQLRKIRDLQEFKLQASYIFSENSDSIKYLQIRDGLGQNIKALNLSQNEIKTLYTAMSKDIENQTENEKEKLTGGVFAIINMHYSISLTDYQGEVREKFVVSKTTTNTIKALTELGLEEYTKVQDPQNVVAVVQQSDYLDGYRYYGLNLSTHYNDRYVNFETNSFVQFSPEETQQILKAVRPYLTVEQENEPYFIVCFAQDGNNVQSIYEDAMGGIMDDMIYYIPYSDAPQFVKDSF